MPVAHPDFELRNMLRSLRGPGFILLAQPAFFPSVISSFLTQNKGGPGPPKPLPYIRHCILMSQEWRQSKIARFNQLAISGSLCRLLAKRIGM